MNIKDIYKHPVETAKAAKFESFLLASSIGTLTLSGVAMAEAKSSTDYESSTIGMALSGFLIASATYALTDKFKQNETIQDLNEKFEVIIKESEGRISVIDGMPVLKIQRSTTRDSQV